jgi:hypothetical protein
MTRRSANATLIALGFGLLAGCDISPEATIRQKAVERDSKPVMQGPPAAPKQPAKGVAPSDR